MNWSAQPSGQPIQISPGNWVYPSGQPVTGSLLDTLNNASTVQPATSSPVDLSAANLATAEAAAAPAAAAPGFFSESTILPPYSNGQVLALGGGAFALLYLVFKRR
jgi:hypothetical protein